MHDDLQDRDSTVLKPGQGVSPQSQQQMKGRVVVKARATEGKVSGSKLARARFSSLSVRPPINKFYVQVCNQEIQRAGFLATRKSTREISFQVDVAWNYILQIQQRKKCKLFFSSPTVCPPSSKQLPLGAKCGEEENYPSIPWLMMVATNRVLPRLVSVYK